MTDKEKIIAEIERLTEVTGYSLSEYENGRRSAMYDIRKQLIEYINSLPAEQPCEELEEAANKYADDNPSLCLENDGVIYEDFNAPRRNFIAGAQWQKEQMMKSAIDAKIVNDEMSGCVVDCEQGCLVLEPHTYAIGQKLKLLIIKEDEQ